VDFVPLLRQAHFLQAPGSLSISEHYRQRGAVTLGSLLSGVVLGLVLLWADPRPLTRLIVLGIALLGLVGAVLFASLTVEVTATYLRWWFGPGLIRKQVPLAAIRAVEATRTRWLEGWGIHYTRRGWLYNVSGFGAVVIKLDSGKSFLLGTDEPERLAQAIQHAIR